MTANAFHLLTPTPAAGAGFQPTPTTELTRADQDMPSFLFTREIAGRGLIHLAGRSLPDAHTADVLPTGHDLLLAVELDGSLDHVLVHQDCVIWLDSWNKGGRVLVAGPSLDRARTAAERFVEQLRHLAGPGTVRVEFADRELGSRYVDLDVREWAEISRLYPAAVTRSISGLVDHVSTEDSPRLLVWHGRPGTGKTTAIRALINAWKEWTLPVVISDPESLLTDGKYLRRILLNSDDDSKWRLIVMEDAEGLTAAQGGPVSTMLNLADGLLGQGLRCLFLLTTNTELTRIHPALLRPGRCLSMLEFGLLSAAEATALGSPSSRPMTLAEVMCRDVDLVRIDEEPRGILYL